MSALFKALSVVALSLLAAGGPENAPLPSAAFSVNAVNPAASAPVEFLGSREGVDSWFWDFGDGASRIRPTPCTPTRSPESIP
jgi:PKD repeat protein